MLLCEMIRHKTVRREAVPAFEREFDVVVIGLGTSGAVAAVTAAEAGASVCAVDKLNLPGGTATSGGIAGYYYGLPGGRFEKTDIAAQQLRYLAFIDGGTFHPDAKGIAVERELRAAGVEIRYESSVCAVWLDDGGETVRGVRLVTPEGIRDLGCRVLIDGTGNGDVCALAGAGFLEGRASDAQPQPFSSVRVFRHENRFASANFDAGFTTSTDAKELNRAIIDSNSLHCFPPSNSEPARLYYITQLPGHREARLVECDHMLTAKEIIDGSWKERPLGYAYSNFDSHSLDWAFEDDTGCDWMVAASLWGKNMIAPIPLEILTVKGFRNLLVVGRAVSVDHLTASLMRMQRCLQKNGEIAGTAAALAVLGNKTDLRDIDRDELEKRMRASGCLDETALPVCRFPAETWREELGSDKPGEAIWYAASHLPETRGALLAFLSGDDEDAAAHAAIALAVAGDSAGAPVLRRLLLARDEYVPQTSRRHNYPRLLPEAYLLGRVGEPSDAALLLGLARERLADYDTFSYAWRGLLTLGDRFPELRQEIADGLLPILEAEDFRLPILFRNTLIHSQARHEPMHTLFRAVTARKFREWGIPNHLAAILADYPLSWREKRLLGLLSQQ
ncbi:MAG: FAD-dependent oxidoreductase [Lentisphaeria bacterium]|nr:FAD-dependent oxidoreductase [Lentisphaeria bacterium]